MNKKFIKVAGIICASLLVTIGIGVYLFKDDTDYEKYWENIESNIEVSYEGYEKNEVNHVVKIGFKNKSKYIADLEDVKWVFMPNSTYDDIIIQEESDLDGDGTIDIEKSPSELSIRGDKENYYKSNEDRKMGIDPGEKEIIAFKLPKAVTFDEKLYDLDRMEISYNVGFYKFRPNPNTLSLRVSSMGTNIYIPER